MEARAGGYPQRSRALLAQAEEELARADHLQASEKLWGAAANMVKAVAAKRGWRHQSHKNLFDAVDRLGEELGDPDLRAAFQMASSLHTNFYEGWLSPRYVQGSLGTIERFVGRLETLAS